MRCFNNYQVVFLSDVTERFDYPDVVQGSLSAEDATVSTLTLLAFLDCPCHDY